MGYIDRYLEASPDVELTDHRLAQRLLGLGFVASRPVLSARPGFTLAMVCESLVARDSGTEKPITFTPSEPGTASDLDEEGYAMVANELRLLSGDWYVAGPAVLSETDYSRAWIRALISREQRRGQGGYLEAVVQVAPLRELESLHWANLRDSP
jgi:hypothetical protein